MTMLCRWFSVFITLLILAIPLLFSIWIEYVPHHEVIRMDEDLPFDFRVGAKDNEKINVFNVDISDEQIEELKTRLSADRLVAALEDCSLCKDRQAFLRNLSDVMLQFNWKQHQHFLNTFKQYRTEIEGLAIHFVRISLPKEPSKDTVPILLLHGFPGSYWDFYKVIPILTNPVRFGFDFGVKRPLLFEVIVPRDALVSSPLGTASFLMSVWSRFSSRDRSELLNRLFTLDELATVSYLYYLTETTPHALRIMHTFFDDDLPTQRLQVRIPCGILQSPEAPWRNSRWIARHRFLNVTSFTEASRETLCEESREGGTADGYAGEPHAIGQVVRDPSSQHYSVAEGLEAAGRLSIGYIRVLSPKAPLWISLMALP
ncbi:unnamed protein product [Heligmosomoides polygyrus]|uniref:EHN domain-containing protein n=1 Tax=Heligmosomoides polygyrus TaxID=6339 RepID=A0A3P8ALG7_HELPZ|nr:unnamed protein product [Heligmosomoides polygyrus]